MPLSDRSFTLAKSSSRASFFMRRCRSPGVIARTVGDVPVEEPESSRWVRSGSAVPGHISRQVIYYLASVVLDPVDKGRLAPA
jgi:hypothetical protein